MTGVRSPVEGPAVEGANARDAERLTSGESTAALYRLLEAHRREIDAAVRAAVASVPALARLYAGLSEEAIGQRWAAWHERERAALVDGAWDAYTDGLRAQGIEFARLGYTLDEWLHLKGMYRREVLARLPPEPREARALADTFCDLLDFETGTIAGAYLAERQAALEAASSQRDLFAEFFRESSLAKLIYEWTAPPDLGSFVLVAANPTALRGAVRDLEAEIGRTIAAAGSLLVSSELPARFAAVIERREPQRYRYVRELPGLPRAQFEGRCFPLSGRHVAVVFEDVTERQELTDRVARQVEELERSNRDLDEFAYVASHDLKAPLRDIDNLASWIAEDASEALPPASLRHLSTLRARIRRMERLLDDLLEYSRVGRAVPPAADFSAAELVTDAIQLAGPREGFVVRSTGDARLRTPRSPLLQTIRNLVANALKHHDRREGHVEIAITDLGERVRFSVADDGPGIPAGCRERIFRLFQTLRPRDEVEGSGMGLPIVKKLVEAHGGRVEIASAEGRGSVFSFDWPKRWGAEPT